MRDGAEPGLPEHGAMLDALARAEAGRLKALAEDLLPELGAVQVLQSRTGLVMLPMRDTVEGTDFHLGEVLVAEAQVRLADHGAAEGYGPVTGRDMERAMAMALVDAAAAAGLGLDRIVGFVAAAAAEAEAADRARLCRIEATRVEMETF